MSNVKQEQYDDELNIFLCRNEGGLQAMRSRLFAWRDRINSEWVGLSGEDLIRKQGEAFAIAKAIKMIDIGPTLKQGA